MIRQHNDLMDINFSKLPERVEDCILQSMGLQTVRQDLAAEK